MTSTRTSLDGSEPPKEPPPSFTNPGRGFARYAGLGLQFGAVLTLLALAGAWGDARFGSAPWLLLLGVALGFVGATVSLVKQLPPSGGAHKSKPGLHEGQPTRTDRP
jgi:hypothetical protein